MVVSPYPDDDKIKRKALYFGIAT